MAHWVCTVVFLSNFSLWTGIGVDCSDQICDLAIRDKPKCIKLFLAFTLISDTWSFNCKCSDSSWFKMTPSDNFEHVRLHDPRWHLQHHMLSFNICEHSTYLCTGDPVSLVFQSPPPVSDTKIQLTSSTVLRSVQPQSQFNKGVFSFFLLYSSLSPNSGASLLQTQAG